jgi:Tfp pilus assembly protein PilO
MKLSLLKSARDYFKKYSERLTEEERKKAVGYIYVILTLATVSFFGLFAITPTLSTISNLNKQYEDNKLVYDALNKKLSNLQLLDFQYQEIQPNLEAIYSAIPRTTKIPYLTRQLENIASNNNVTVKKLDFGIIEVYPNTKKDPIYSFTFKVDVVGNDAGVNGFISNVINFDRIIGIDRITTGKDADSQSAVSITGRAFFSTK